MEQINANTLNEKHLSGRFWADNTWHLLLTAFVENCNSLSPLKADYLTVYNFITKEQYTAKSGDIDYEGRAGAAALWLASLSEKLEAGEILHRLTIVENHAADEHKASLTLAIPEADCCEVDAEVALPNFQAKEMLLFCISETTMPIRLPTKWFLKVILNPLTNIV